MPGALGDMLDAITAGLAQIPPAVLVIALLFGPTAAYIGFRLYAGPRAARTPDEVDDLYWICPDCKSANERARHRCYLCQTDRETVPGALRVVDHDRILEIDDGPASPLVAVGPGRAPEAAPTHPVVEPAPAATIVPIDEAAKRRRATRAKRPPVAVPIEPELDADEDDVVAAAHVVDAPTRRRKRSSRNDAAS